MKGKTFTIGWLTSKLQKNLFTFRCLIRHESTACLHGPFFIYSPTGRNKTQLQNSWPIRSNPFQLFFSLLLWPPVGPSLKPLPRRSKAPVVAVVRPAAILRLHATREGYEVVVVSVRWMPKSEESKRGLRVQCRCDFLYFFCLGEMKCFFGLVAVCYRTHDHKRLHVGYGGWNDGLSWVCWKKRYGLQDSQWRHLFKDCQQSCLHIACTHKESQRLWFTTDCMMWVMLAQ